MVKKIVTLKEFKTIAHLISAKKKVLVGGCFDILHFGHLTFLKKAKMEGEFLVVAVESDAFILKNKKRKPIHTQEQRAEILASTRYVDLVIKLPLLEKDEEYLELVELIKPTVIGVTGGDSQVVNKRKQAAKINAQLIIVTSYIKGFSSKKIISKLNQL